jgi:hypothetical protein
MREARKLAEEFQDENKNRLQTSSIPAVLFSIHIL